MDIKLWLEKNHRLFYMYDLNVYAENDNDLEALPSTVKDFTDDTEMQFCLEKCVNATLNRGSIVKSKIITLDMNVKNTELEDDKS